MGAAAPFIALGVSVLGTMQGGIAENKSERRAALQDEENGRLSYLAGEQQAMDVQRQGLIDTGGAAADLAESGLAWGGSIGTVLADSARQVEMDIDRVRERAAGEAANHYAQARERRRAGKQALIGSAFSALSTAIGGVSQIRQQRRLDTQAASERAVRLGGSSIMDPRRAPGRKTAPRPGVMY